MLRHDLRFALRMLAKRPAFTLIAVLTLGLGIGLNSTVFTFVNAVLLRGLPFDEGHRVMYVKTLDRERGENAGVSYPDYRDLRDQSQTFESLAGFNSGTMILSDGAAVPERLVGSWLTANAFRVVGVEPVIGRDFAPEEEQAGAAPVVLLAHGLWQQRYGGRGDVLGESVRINGVPATIIGVMPEGMGFPDNNDLWMPMVPDADDLERDDRDLAVFGRLADGASLTEARLELDAMSSRFAEQFPDTHDSIEFSVLSYNDQFNGGEIKVLFLVLMAAVGFVLLIACANVANLLLARSASRAREMSVRSAMGAGRLQLVRQLLLESVLMSGLGGLVGLGLSAWGVRLFDLAVANVGKPYWIDFSIDWKVIVFLAGVCLLTGVLFGLAPALHAARTDLAIVLRDGGRGQAGGTRVRRATATLVVVQLALTTVLLFGAGLMIKSFQTLRHLDLGVETANVLTLRIGLPEAQYPDAERQVAFRDALDASLHQLPGIESIAVTSHLPLDGSFRWSYELADAPVTDGHERPLALGLIVGSDYFSTLKIQPLRGRVFEALDGGDGLGSVIVNQSFAEKHWGLDHALGQRLRLGEAGDGPWLTVVGVAPAVRQRNPNDVEVEPMLYLPYRQDPRRFFTVLARSQVPPETLALDIQKAVQAIDADLAVYFVKTLDAHVHDNSWAFRVFSSLFGIFALIAVLLSSVGVYAVMSYAVAQRLPEIAVRLAMGADGRRILWLVLQSGVRQWVIGLVVGVPAALALGRVLEGLMVQVKPHDPATLATIVGFLAVTAILACVIPAVRALRVDPVAALRE